MKLIGQQHLKDEDGVAMLELPGDTRVRRFTHGYVY